MEKRYIFFDLDGTLTDSFEGIAKAFDYALNAMGIESKPETYKDCVGPSVVESFKKHYGTDEETAVRGLELFREYYDSFGYKQGKLYPEIENVLMTLNAHGKKLMVATGKPDEMAKKVLEYFNISEQFCFAAGLTLGDTLKNIMPRQSKEDVIDYILKTNSILDPENAVMIGDRGGDIAAAHRFGIETIGVTYGYGTESELISAGADYIASDPLKLIEMIVQS